MFYCDTAEVGLDWPFVKITLSASWKMDELDGGLQEGASVRMTRPTTTKKRIFVGMQVRDDVTMKLHKISQFKG